MYAIYLDIWKIGEVRLETKFGQKTACLDMSTLFPNLNKKITGFNIWKGFGGDLEDTNIWFFEHLDR